jgi:excisionase family DNA binding protein
MASFKAPSNSDDRHRSDQSANARGRQSELVFFTISYVAELVDVDPRTVRRWIDAGKLPAHRIGAVVRIAESDLRAFLATHRR